MQEKRKNQEFRDHEKEQMQEKRKSQEFRDHEKEQMQEKRKYESFRRRENLMKRRREFSFLNMIQEFHKSVEEGPLYVCTCCDQLWYRESVRLTSFSVNEDLAAKCITGVKSGNDKEWICNTCTNSLKRNKIPALSKANNVKFPELPLD